MNYHCDCEKCGRRVTAYVLPMNRGLAQAFLKFADAYLAQARPIDKGTLGLTNSQYGNFQNLRHFGLILQEEKGKGWFLTAKGAEFLHGARIQSPVAHFGSETLPDDHLAWSTHTGPRGDVSLADVIPAEWKQREEYQREKKDTVT